MQPHSPSTHTPPLALPVQSTHAEANPHVAVEVPAVHFPMNPPQQKPAPQPPPSQSAAHNPPAHVGVSPPHAMHFPPAEPHSAPELPGTHVVPLQHPPLQWSPPAQALVHSPVFGWQASPLGQLVDVQGTWVSLSCASCAASEVRSAVRSASASRLASTVASGAPPSATGTPVTPAESRRIPSRARPPRGPRAPIVARVPPRTSPAE